MTPLEDRLTRPPHTALILGSGLGDIDLGKPDLEIPYSEIPDFPAGRVEGHPGRLSVIGPLLVLRGRAHYYEGHDLDAITRPVALMARLGVETLVVTNAAGAINPALRPGDLMAITDHLNLMGVNPLRGSPRFVDMTRAYDPELLRRAAAAARRCRIRLRRGVYAAVAGPSYETPAEVRMLRKLGADAVGMSTVPEVIAAAAAGLRVFGLSILTNAAAGRSRRPVSHDEVLETMRTAAARVERLLGALFSAGERP